MNNKLKRLISFLTLDARINSLNCFIGYLTSLEIKNDAWQYIIDSIIEFDKSILNIFEKDKNETKLKEYGIIINKSYTFISEEFCIGFLKEAAFNNSRVANIKDYNAYVLARRLLLNEYEKNKGVS